jgi:hypothetical protein
MKKMMIYLLAAGIGICVCIPTDVSANNVLRHHRHHKRDRGWNENRMIAVNNDYSGYNYMNYYPQPALPVLEDYIPADVVNNLKNTYGQDLYDITTVKTMNGDDSYVVRVIKDGVVQTINVNSNGTPIM